MGREGEERGSMKEKGDSEKGRGKRREKRKGRRGMKEEGRNGGGRRGKEGERKEVLVARHYTHLSLCSGV